MYRHPRHPEIHYRFLTFLGFSLVGLLRWPPSAKLCPPGSNVLLRHWSRRSQHFLRMSSTWQKLCSTKYVAGNASNNSFTSPKVLENAHCTKFKNL